MSERILVVYASGSGSTAEVAEAIGQTIRDSATEVDVQPVNKEADLSTYDAVVMGSSIRAGRWLPIAIQFLERHRDEMAEMPVAYFTTCLTMVNDTPESRRTVLAYMEPLRQMAPQIEPVGLGLFAGSLVPELEPILPTQSVLYGDYRDWEVIAAWAREIKPQLVGRKTGPAAPIVLSQTVLSYTDMSGLDLRHIQLTQSQLHEAKLRETNLRGANLLQSELIGADLEEADLSEAGLGWSDLSNSNLRKADLSQANLIGALLNQADLSDADLSQAILNGATLTGAKLNRSILHGADLNWANLQRADLTGADLRHADLSWADFSKATLTNVDLRDARCNRQTKWPEGFSAEEAGCILIARTR